MRKITLLLVLLAAACNSAPPGPQRFDVSGKATFDGKPIPSGKIMFEPDSTKGNEGPQGSADILNGVFDTKLGGKGTVGGPHNVRLQGFDGKKVEGWPDGQPIFIEFTIPADLPKESTTKDFDVPRKAADELPKTPARPA